MTCAATSFPTSRSAEGPETDVARQRSRRAPVLEAAPAHRPAAAARADPSTSICAGEYGRCLLAARQIRVERCFDGGRDLRALVGGSRGCSCAARNGPTTCRMNGASQSRSADDRRAVAATMGPGHRSGPPPCCRAWFAVWQRFIRRCLSGGGIRSHPAWQYVPCPGCRQCGARSTCGRVRVR